MMLDFISGILNFFDQGWVHVSLWGSVIGVLILWGLAILCIPMCIAGIIIGIKFRRRHPRRGTLFIIGSVVAIPLCLLYIFWLANAEIHVGFVRPPTIYEETAIEVFEGDIDETGFTANGVRYEMLDYPYGDIRTHMAEVEPVFYCRYEHSPENKNYGFNYYRLIGDNGLELYTDEEIGGDQLYCRADQKEQVMAYLADPVNFKWYANLEYDRFVELSDELIAEIEAGYGAMDESKSIKLKNPRTETIYLEQISSEVLQVAQGVEIERYWGKLYYNITNFSTLEDPYHMELVPLPAELEEKLLTAMEE